MDPADTLLALKLRRDLTGESFNDGTIEAWADALDHWPLPDVRKAIITASRTHNRISVALVVEQLPPKQRLPHTPLDKCELCDDTGWVEAPPRHHANERTSTQVKPCRCTRGRQMKETQRRIYEANNR